MSRLGGVTLEWAGEERRFALRIGELVELQEETGVGPAALLRRLQDGSWRVRDARTIMLLGLIGGGLRRAEAETLVKRWCDPPEPLAASIMPASVVLMSALVGAPDDPAGKEDAPTPPATTDGASGNSPTTGAPAAPPD